MYDADIKRRTLAIIANHAVAAQASQYDRIVAITAIANARKAVETLLARQDGLHDLGRDILETLTDLHSTYHDPDGEYTNGKGILGSLIGDIAEALSADNPD